MVKNNSLKIKAVSSTAIEVTDWLKFISGSCHIRYDICTCSSSQCENIDFEKEFNSGKCISVQNQNQSIAWRISLHMSSVVL